MRRKNRLWIKLFFVSIIALAGFFAATYILLVVRGKTLVMQQLQRLTARKVSIGHLEIRSPLVIEMRDVSIEGIGNVASVTVAPSILSLLYRFPVFNYITVTSPEMTYHRRLPAVIDIDTIFRVTPPLTQITKRYPYPVVIRHLTIQNGVFHFIDDTVVESVHLTFKHIRFSLNNVYYLVPRPVTTTFNLRGVIPWQGAHDAGIVNVGGWVNLYKKDIKTKVRISNIDGVYLYPYYGNWLGIDLKKARIEKARLNFLSDISGTNNDVSIDGRLELTNIVRQPIEELEETVALGTKVADREMDFFLAFNEGKVVVNFKTKTRLDRFEFSPKDVQMAFEEKVAQAREAASIKGKDVVKLPVTLARGTFKGFFDLTSALVMGTVSAGKELGKAVGAAFRREK